MPWKTAHLCRCAVRMESLFEKAISRASTSWEMTSSEELVSHAEASCYLFGIRASLTNRRCMYDLGFRDERLLMGLKQGASVTSGEVPRTRLGNERAWVFVEL